MPASPQGLIQPVGRTATERPRRWFRCPGAAQPGDELDDALLRAHLAAHAPVVARVHAAGGRIAIHTQHPEGAEAAVDAGADSIEHGMLLPHRLLDRMAAQGTVLVPTMTVIRTAEAARHVDPPTAFSRFMVEGVDRHPSMVRAAAEAGVLVLAGTDSAAHHGDVANEAALLAAAGVRSEDAIGAATWNARRFLGLPGLEEGAPADLIVCDTDPRADVGALAHPTRVVLKGKVIK